MDDDDLYWPPPSTNVDYLSNLPDSLLLHILSSLTAHNSVRTSVLARRWRNLWASVPIIFFDYYDFHPDIVSGAEEIVNRFIASRRSSSAVFSLCMNLNLIFPVTWIEYAKSHGTQSVTLYLFYHPLQTSIFGTLFNWSSLLVLHLQFDFAWPRVDIPPGCIVLSNLKTLSLRVGVFSDESMRMLLASCPNLEILFLDFSENYDAAIEIAILNLRRLVLKGTKSKTRINCRNLESLSIDSSSYLQEFHVYAPSLVCVHLAQFRWCHRLASSLRNVAELSISLLSLPANLAEHLSMIESFKLFHKIKKLKIHLHLRYAFTMQLLFLFLREIPNVPSLHLVDDTFNEEQFLPFSLMIDAWRESLQIMPYRSLNNLKLVLVEIEAERVALTTVEMLSERVQEWDRVDVRCIE
ncbi:F-box/LRR-repeat protein At3g26922-like [Zingiber officinale]|uniref:F-box domain-containing protein n=1 Tax=Zingiber officinale TaxID=94328 RepID=A0A8J5H022_ZINOF|nr:F-box/LRR-repeat protein At3g26922-like [Zingiber officinale]KAG6516943.1 hypothetical protein ZIOFF_020318 [Zingiber officinale]